MELPWFQRKEIVEEEVSHLFKMLISYFAFNYTYVSKVYSRGFLAML